MQEPQNDVDVLVFVSQPSAGLLLQSAKPVLHDATVHAPLLQPAVPFCAGHALHVLPLLPQLPPDWPENASQVVELLQHPVHPDEVLHAQAPALQVVPVAHPLHVLPPVPQEDDDWPLVATHVFPLQHPVHPEEVLQTQAPPLQA